MGHGFDFEENRHSRRNIPALTGIRAIAALLVLGIHTDLELPANIPTVLPFMNRGYLGVDLFFVLSGFIISHVYLDSFARLTANNLRVFVWHRFIRLYPMHATVLVGLIGMVVVAKLAGINFRDQDGWRGIDLFWQFTLLHAWGVSRAAWNSPSWSISAEWFAYLTFPVLAIATLRIRKAANAFLLAIAALTAMSAVFALTGHALPNWLDGFALVRVEAEFICGMMLCRVIQIGIGGQRRWSGDWIGLAAFVIFLLGASANLSDFSLVGLLTLTVFGTATADGPLAQLLSNRPVVWLGEISYSLYMVHLPILIVCRWLADRFGFLDWYQPAKVLAFLAADVLVIVVAAFLFNLVERPARTRFRNVVGVLRSPSERVVMTQPLIP
jgi:peptidoglycan/LPS O-acetylase OafA/YrhL